MKEGDRKQGGENKEGKDEKAKEEEVTRGGEGEQKNRKNGGGGK